MREFADVACPGSVEESISRHAHLRNHTARGSAELPSCILPVSAPLRDRSPMTLNFNVQRWIHDLAIWREDGVTWSGKSAACVITTTAFESIVYQKPNVS